MTFSANVERVLEELNSLSWFAAVGQPLSEPADQVNSWDAAMRASRDERFRGMKMRLLVEHSAHVTLAGIPATEWTEMRSRAQETAERIAARHCATVLEDPDATKELSRVVATDIAAFLMEVQYEEIWEPTFFAGNMVWYAEGHFPCGSKGQAPPNGNWIVF